MAIVIKGLVIGGGVAALATGSYFVATSLAYKPTVVKDASSDKSEYTENKIGKDYEYFLVDPFAEHNQSWWEGSYRRWKEDKGRTSSPRTFSDEFKDDAKVTAGFVAKDGQNAATSVNNICHSVYKKAKTDMEGEAHKALREDLFSYCSILEGVPKTIKDAGETSNYSSSSSNNIGKEKEGDLVAAGTNDIWWNTKTREFYEGSEPTEEFFKKFYKEGKDKSSRRPLRDRCREAYGQQSGESSEDVTTTEETLKHCSLERK